MKRLIILGASGHGRVCADIAELMGYEEIVFLDQNPEAKECGGRQVLGPDTMAQDLEGDIFVAVGNPEAREKLMDKFAGRHFATLVHPSAVIAKGVEIGEGSVAMAGAIVNPGARLGRGYIVNTASSVDHDCVLGDFVHVAVGAHLAGTVTVGSGTWIGAGATVSNNVEICSRCMIGAGAVVVKDIATPGTYVGVPARKK